MSTYRNNRYVFNTSLLCFPWLTIFSSSSVKKNKHAIHIWKYETYIFSFESNAFYNVYLKRDNVKIINTYSKKQSN